MTRIDCVAASANGLSPAEYIDGFAQKGRDCILLATDEECNDFIRLDVQSAEALARRLLQMAAGIRRNRQQSTVCQPLPIHKKRLATKDDRSRR